MPHNTPEKRRAYVLKNKERRNQQCRDWYQKQIESNPQFNRERYLQYQQHKLAYSQEYYQKFGRAAHLKKTYNITPEQAIAIFEFQSQRCAICQSSEPGWRNKWYVDHAHNETKEVRGILCLGCNRVLGYIETRPVLLEGCPVFQDYLENPPARFILNPSPLAKTA